jgi:hypothetical protein
MLLVLPLIGVMALWLYSYGHSDSWQTVAQMTRYRIAALDGTLFFERHRLAAGEDANSPTASADTHLVPFWVVWLATATVTVGMHFQVRATGRRVQG